jgi:hypothetical protein
VTGREVLFLVVGLSLGALSTLVIARVRRAVALRAERTRHEKRLAQERAQTLREKLELATQNEDWQLDEAAVFSALFSDDGMEVQKELDQPAGPTGEIARRQPAPDESPTSKTTSGRGLEKPLGTSLGSTAQVQR